MNIKVVRKQHNLSHGKIPNIVTIQHNKREKKDHIVGSHCDTITNSKGYHFDSIMRTRQ